MHILHINANFITTKLHRNMIQQLSDCGVENSIIVPTYMDAQIDDENVHVLKCFKKIDRIAYLYKQKKIVRATEREVDISTFDIIHSYTLFTDGNTARELSKKYKIPYVVAVRNTDVNAFFKFRPYLRGLGIKILRDASAIFFLSESYKNQVFDKYVPQNLLSEFEKKTYIIPNGIDNYWHEQNIRIIDKNKLHTVNNKNIRLVYAGRIDRNKNIETIQKAMNILQNQRFKVSLSIAGKIENRRVLSVLKKNDNTTYHGEKTKEELIHIYDKSDIFVMPSFTESFGLVYVEAMSRGLPVVYTQGQGFDGQFKEGMVGYHVNPHDPNSVALAIKKVVSNYENISNTCIVSTDKYSWKNICDKYIVIYESIYQEKRSGGLR